jgi:hypothetical protein
MIQLLSENANQDTLYFRSFQVTQAIQGSIQKMKGVDQKECNLEFSLCISRKANEGILKVYKGANKGSRIKVELNS